MPAAVIPPTLPQMPMGYGSSFVGNYTNLPGGITNAGGTTGNNAYVGAVQPDSTVASQLSGLLASDSPYLEQARQSGIDDANGRGLLNSGISSGNVERAAIQSSLPIAAQDAATSAGLQTTNLNNLNQILATRMNNTASMHNAADAAGASEYATSTGLLNNREQRSYEGDQAGVNRSFADYMQQQGFGNQSRQAAFTLGGQMLLNSQNFNNSLFLNASQNPFMMADPQALQGFSDFANQGQSGYYDDLFGAATNGGNSLPQWQENNQWYQTPDYSQQYGNGNYAGGGPQLPFYAQPSIGGQ